MNAEHVDIYHFAKKQWRTERCIATVSYANKMNMIHAFGINVHGNYRTPHRAGSIAITRQHDGMLLSYNLSYPKNTTQDQAPTPSTKYQTPNTKHQTKHQKSNTKHQTQKSNNIRILSAGSKRWYKRIDPTHPLTSGLLLRKNGLGVLSKLDEVWRRQRRLSNILCRGPYPQLPPEETCPVPL